MVQTTIGSISDKESSRSISLTSVCAACRMVDPSKSRPIHVFLNMPLLNNNRPNFFLGKKYGCVGRGSCIR